MTQNLYPADESGHEAENTLRSLTQLPPPSGLADRVHYRLELEQAGEQGRDRTIIPARRGLWSLWMPVRRLQFAGAAVLVLALAGSMWTVRHTKSGVQMVQPVVPGPAFGTGGAERHPSNLTPIKVPPAPKKKPSASHTAIRKTARPASTQSAASQDRGKSAIAR